MLRVLLIEDSEDDALLILRGLRQGGYNPVSRRVQDSEAVAQALTETWDVILSDYVLPSFNALDALELYGRAGLDIPFIVVSGNIGEDIAVAAMKAGAHDYIMKNNLARLVPAIERELKETQERQKRRLAEEDLKLAKFALDQAEDMIAWFDEQGNFFYVNDATCALLGFSRNQLLGMNVKNFSPGGDPEKNWAKFTSDLRRKGAKTLEAILPTSGGKLLSVEVSTKYMAFQGKNYICGIARDISERKQAEKIRLELAGERDRLLQQLQIVLESMPIGCILNDTDFRVTYWNPAAEKIFGYSSDEMLGKVSREVVTPVSLHPLVLSIRDDLRKGIGPINNINENIRKDGRLILCEWHNMPLKNQDGGFVGHLTMVQDITEQMQSEEVIVRHSTRVESLLRVVSRLNAHLDLKTVLGLVCQEVQTVLGASTVTVSFYSESDNTLERATGIGIMAEKESRSLPRWVFNNLIDQGIEVVHDIQTYERLPDLENLKKVDIHTAVFAAMKFNEDFIGCINAFYAGPSRTISEDEQKLFKGLADQAALAIANARLFERVLDGQERMRHLNVQVLTAQEEERRRLSRELHDESGQALTALKIYLELILADLPENLAPIRVRIEEAAELAGATLEQIRLLAQALRPPALDTLGLNAALEDYCREFSKRTRTPIIYCGLDMVFQHDAFNICLYRFLQEALTNVAKHAQAKRVQVHLQLEEGCVCLTVKDDGQGFKKEWMTGGNVKGIGLLGMKERLEALGGTLRMESRAGHGTCLTASIPMEDAP